MSDRRLVLSPVEPTGRTKQRAFIGGVIVELENDVYPDVGGFALRSERRRLCVGLRAAAARLGIRVSELSGLEFGALTCDWELAMQLLRDGGQHA